MRTVIAVFALSVLASKATAQTPPQPRATERGVSVEIHIFLGDARAKPDNLSYPPGQKQALLIMLKQPRATAPEWRRAEALAATKGWYDVKLSKASTVDERADCWLAFTRRKLLVPAGQIIA